MEKARYLRMTHPASPCPTARRPSVAKVTCRDHRFSAGGDGSAARQAPGSTGIIGCMLLTCRLVASSSKPFSGRAVPGLRGAVANVVRLALVLTALLLTLVQAVRAQPVVGSTYKEFLPMGSGSSVALPAGTWQSTHRSTLSSSGIEWENYTLKNLQADAHVPYLVVRQALGFIRWSNTSCHYNSSITFMVNEHGTSVNQLVNKCSLYSAIGNFDKWKDTSAWNNPRREAWWKDVIPGLMDPAKANASSMLIAELSVRQFNGNGIQVEAFIRPPQNISARQFRDDFKAGKSRPEHDILAMWASIYIESIQRSYFDKKPEPIMALTYPVEAGEPWPSARAGLAAEAVPAPPVAPAAAALLAQAASSAQPAAPATAAAAPVATPRPMTAVAANQKPVPATPAPTGVTDTVQRLALERQAMEEEKRKMAQQLEAMAQLLAKLQQENAAAAKARELAATKASSAPKAPVVYANRKALVIGNDNYSDVPKLSNAAADAQAMARSLQEVGYQVFLHLNLNEKKLKQALRDFRQQLNGGDEVLFFFAGHGVQLGNANYLLPVDIQGDHEDQVKDESILLQKVLDDLEEKKTKFTLAVIDACRDNPFKGKGRAIGGRGLAPTSAATGQMIMFSAGSGQQALDRLGDQDTEKNGLFTRIFVKEMHKPGLSVDRVLRNVRQEVVRLARSVGHEQTPALYDQAIGEFYFRQ